MIHYIYYGDDLQSLPSPFITVYSWEPGFQERDFLQHIGNGKFINRNLQVDIPAQLLLDKHTKDVYALMVCDDARKPNLRYKTRLAYNLTDTDWEDML